jgi:hypothetical protein
MMQAGQPERDRSFTPQNKAELLACIRQERARLEQAIAGLTEAQFLAPGPEGWSVKDHLAHLVTWEQILLVTHLQGRPFAEGAGMDAATAEVTAHMTAETGLNDYFYERDRHLPLAQVLADFHRSYQQVMAALETADFDNWTQPEDADDPESALLHHIIANTSEHYQEHADIIEAITR